MAFTLGSFVAAAFSDFASDLLEEISMLNPMALAQLK
jgi:hypothetical protein